MGQNRQTTCSKPAGGYVRIGVEQICAVWTAYSEKRIRLIDLRAWFACWELVARRCQIGPKRQAEFSVGELHRLIGGVGGKHVRASLKRLADGGFLRWSAAKLEFPEPSDFLHPQFGAMLGAIANNKRRVPVPRRILRFLAGDASRVTMATILAHLLRCLYFRNGGFVPSGTCKASWIASVFRVDARNVKAARRQLIAIGWLVPGTAPQWRLNRFGAVMSINLNWASPTARQSNVSPNEVHEMPSTKSPLPRARIVTGSPLLESDQKLLPEYKNQKPACGRPPGAWKQELKTEPSTAPCWERLCPEDLRIPKRLFALYRDAVSKKRVAAGEAGRLAFVGAAVHARMMGRTNPCGMFRTIVEKRLWHFITQEAEDRARTRLRQLDEASRKPQPTDSANGSIGNTIQGVLAALTRAVVPSRSQESELLSVTNTPREFVPRGEPLRSLGIR